MSLLFYLLVQGLRQLFLWRPHKRPAGEVLVTGVLLVEICTFILTIALPGPDFLRKDWPRQRSDMLLQLRQTPGKHLIVVRYGPNHNPLWEWVYNEADIDAAKVVWAREMDPLHDRQLLDYFSDRQVWLLEADSNPPHLSPYPGEGSRPAGPP
jgi:hypothetical protein